MCPAQLSLLRAWAPSLPTPPGQDLHAVPVITSGLCPRVLTRLLPVLQMAPSEGAVTQIGLLSQDIHRLTTLLSQDQLLNDSRLAAPSSEDWR